jgi:hypothetical protein
MIRKFLFSLIFFLLPLTCVFAATDIFGEKLPGVKMKIESISTNWFQEILLKNVINKLIGLSAAFSVVFVIVGGYQYLTAFGNDEQVKQAHKTIIWSLVGLILTMLSFAIVQILVGLDFGKSKIETKDSEFVKTICEGSVVDLGVPAERTEICNAMEFDTNCTIKDIQIELGGIPTSESKHPDDTYYYDPNNPNQKLKVSCSKIDGYKGACTNKALKNYFKENVCK